MAEKTYIQKKLSTDRNWKLKRIAIELRLNQQEALDAIVDEKYKTMGLK